MVSYYPRQCFQIAVIRYFKIERKHYRLGAPRIHNFIVNRFQFNFIARK